MRNGCVGGGAEALQALRREAAAGRPYQIIIIDRQMPEMDGLLLARAIKDESSLAQPRMILLTALGEHYPDETLREAGISACLTKPIKQSQLYDCLVQALAREFGERSPSPQAKELRPALHPLAPGAITQAMRILVAEDNPVNQKVALAQLQKLGYRAEAVADGWEVLQALERAHYDVVLMDCQMPNMDGYEAARRIRDTPRLKSVRLVAMTANAMHGDREKCLAAGMDDYLTKPMRTEDMARVLNATGSSPAAPATENSETASLDSKVLQNLKSLVGSENEKMLDEIVSVFFTNTSESLFKLRQACEQRQPKGLKEVAHALKGSSGNLGANRLVALCKSLERAGSNEAFAEAQDIVETMEAEFAQVRAGLEAELRKT